MTLIACGLRKTHPGAERAVLEDISLRLEPGGSLAVVGPSGSGKSSLLNLLGTLDRPDAGTISLDGVAVCELSGPALASFRASSLGFVFQEHHLLPQLTARENVLLPAMALGAVTSAAQRRADELLTTLGLAGRADAFPARMSGGERQRVAVARALVNRPRLLLCDEPTGSLDRATAAAVAEQLFALARDAGAMLVVATHDPALAARCAGCLTLAGRTP